MARKAVPTAITVLAGTNGAGKSSVAGAALRSAGGEYFNPDEAAKGIVADNPSLTQTQANSEAWELGRRMLERAIEEKREFAFETTLGGRTISALLDSALDARIEVRLWYVGLDSAERHIARVKARVARGGHSIPEQKIRERYTSSLLNLCRLAPRLTEMVVHDNSREADPSAGIRPRPILIVRAARGKIVEMCHPSETPDWAKPVIMALLHRS